MVVNQSLTCFMKSLKVWSSLKLMNKSGKEYELQPRIISQKKNECDSISAHVWAKQ